jgi:hypothetical protein
MWLNWVFLAYPSTMLVLSWDLFKMLGFFMPFHTAKLHVMLEQPLPALLPALPLALPPCKFPLCCLHSFA